MSAVHGWSGKLGVHANNPVELRFDFQSESLAVNEAFIDTNGLRGTRSRSIERVRQGNRRIGGQIRMQPTAVELAALLPWILGANASGNTYALADTLQSRYVTVDRSIKVSTYNGVVVDRATFRAGQGEPLDLTLDVCGLDETIGNSGTFPDLSLDLTTQPFVFTDLALVINATTVNAKSIELVIDNAIDKERFFNSQTAVSLPPMDRHVYLNTQLPYGDASALYGTGAGGVACTATFTNGGTSLLFSLVKVAFPRRSPTFVAGRQEVLLPLNGTAYTSSTTKELVCTLDSSN